MPRRIVPSYTVTVVLVSSSGLHPVIPSPPTILRKKPLNGTKALAPLVPIRFQGTHGFYLIRAMVGRRDLIFICAKWFLITIKPLVIACWA